MAVDYGNCDNNCTFKNNSIIYLQIETTEFGEDADIISITAKIGYKHDFVAFIMPTRRIHPRATAKNGFTCDGEDLYLNGEPVETTNDETALEEFHEYITLHCNYCTLVCHNARSFHLPILFSKIRNEGLDYLFNDVIYGYCDTLPLFKSIFPHQEVYNLRGLASNLLNVNLTTYAMHKLITLRRLVRRGTREGKLFRFQTLFTDQMYHW